MDLDAEGDRDTDYKWYAGEKNRNTRCSLLDKIR